MYPSSHPNRGPHGSGPRSNVSAAPSQPAPAIRAGLSVQELKAMTAMRMATSGEPAARPVVSHHRNPSNIASSYQTATPQQLVSAGILPVVINERNYRSRNPPARAVNYGSSAQQSAPYYSSPANIGQSNRPVGQLSPYHQQLLPRRGPTDQDKLDMDLYNRDSQWMESNRGGLSHLDSGFNAISANTNSNFLDGALSSDMMGHRSLHSDRPNIAPLSTDSKYQPDYRNINGSNSLLMNTPSSFNEFREHRGPEVRSPPFSSQFAAPHEHGEPYTRQSDYRAMNSVEGLKDSLASLTMNANPENFLAHHRPSPFDQPISGKPFPFHKARSQPSIETGLFVGGSDDSSKNFALKPHHPILPSIDVGRDQLLDGPVEDYGDNLLERSLLSKNPSNHFPLLKSKTAPKLGAMDGSPAASPSMKLLARKLLGANNKDLRINADPSLLPDEMAEAVLGTPPGSGASVTRGAGKSRSPTFNHGGFFSTASADGASDDRFAWDVALDDEEPVVDDSNASREESANFYVDGEEKARFPSNQFQDMNSSLPITMGERGRWAPSE